MIRRPIAAAITFSLLSYSAQAARSQMERATATEQQAAELAAAGELAARLEGAKVSTWALDPRLVVRGIVTTRVETKFGRPILVVSSNPDLEPTTEIPVGHTPAHLAEVMKVLGIGNLLDDEKAACVRTTAALCRIGSYAGLVRFGSAWVSAHTAQIAVMVDVPDRAAKWGPIVRGATYSMTLDRSEGTWKVIAVSVTYAN